MRASPETLQLYTGSVFHRRHVAPCTTFRYRTISILADIDELPEAGRRLRWFSHNRGNLVALHDRDHGPKDGTPLRPWIDARLADAGIDLAGGRVQLLCYPRLLGYVFNPLSLWLCHHSDGRILAVLCEVRNTFGESHSYLLHQDGAALQWPVRGEATKVFHVSPLLPMSGHYTFRFDHPGQRLTTAVYYYREATDVRPALTAVQCGTALPATDRTLLRTAARRPFTTRRVMGAIHWQALRLWLRGARFHRKPAPPTTEVSQ